MIKDTSGQDVIVRKKTNLKTWLWAGAGIIALLGLGSAVARWQAWSENDAVVARAELRLAQVAVADISRDTVVQGRIVAADSPTLYSPAQGVVTYAIKAGDAVKQGQLLAEIDSPALTSSLKQEQANLARLKGELERLQIQARRQALENQQAVDLARVDLDAAEREMRRAELSLAKQVISQLDHEQAQDELARARLRHRQSEQNAGLAKDVATFEQQNLQHQVDSQALVVAELQRQVDQLQVRSPVSGMVGALASNQKGAVTAHQALLTVVDLSSFEVEVQVPDNYADDLGLAMPVSIRLNGANFPGEVAAISPEVIGSQVNARLRFVGDIPANLRQNQRLTATIKLESRNQVLAVQRGAFVDADGGRYAFRLDGDRAIRTPIRLGAMGMKQVEILDGLSPGDTIIVSDTSRFKDANSLLLTE
ncbi:HlyD family efflux transporter periplasmic adaptor subunit [Gallaecimonas sp. GXIMD4217]|uniref:efflux RND transporter periplasmic adaptor subunit n=1 Tax=Gallaecimonas sp. GXIMD4217 TaxID=3131927 RepID=UPI00311AD446